MKAKDDEIASLRAEVQRLEGLVAREKERRIWCEGELENVKERLKRRAGRSTVQPW